MQFEFAKLWKHFPKIFLGNLFCFEMLIIIFGSNKVTLHLEEILDFIFPYAGEVVTGLIILFGIFVIGELGISILNVFYVVSISIQKKMGGNKYFSQVSKKYPILFISSGEMARKLYLDYRKDFLSYLRLRSIVEPPYDNGKVKLIEKVLKKIDQHIMEISNIEFLENIGHYSTVLYEQSHERELRWE